MVAWNTINKSIMECITKSGLVLVLSYQENC